MQMQYASGAGAGGVAWVLAVLVVGGGARSS